MDECCKQAADARAEEIATRLRGEGYSEATVEKWTGCKPKTRERVLEDALRVALEWMDSGDESFTGRGITRDRAERALDWRPE